MAAGKRSAGERVLESKHVIGLFLLMLVFSGIFFSLGYVMGRNQYDGQVRAANNAASDSIVMAKPDALKKKVPSTSVASSTTPSTNSDSDPATSSASGWDNPPVAEPHHDPAPPTPAVSTSSKKLNAKAKVDVSPAPVAVSSKIAKTPANAPLIPSGALLLQVAACSKQDDALNIAGGLQKKQFAAFVQPPQKDKFYRVQVGPFRDQKSADAAKKGLEGAGFKAFFVKH
jgi:cell division septation protein DedD